jgi:hypothetical protein
MKAEMVIDFAPGLGLASPSAGSGAVQRQSSELVGDAPVVILRVVRAFPVRPPARVVEHAGPTTPKNSAPP